MGLVFSLQGFSPDPAECCVLWSLPRGMRSRARMHVPTHAGRTLSLAPLPSDSPVPAPLPIFPDSQTC